MGKKVMERINDIHIDYDSPINIITQMSNNILQMTDDGVVKAVVKAGFNIDKDKLISILQGEKQRYSEAFKNGYNARNDEIVRCKDCKYGKIHPCAEYTTCLKEYSCLYMNTRSSDWYCADGERKEADDICDDD